MYSNYMETRSPIAQHSSSSPARKNRPPPDTLPETPSAATTMTATVSPARILRPVGAFLDEALSQTDLRRRILSSARRLLPASTDAATLQALTTASQLLETVATATSKPSPSSLRAAEQLLVSLPRPSLLSALLLSLVYSLRRRHADAALSLLDLFAVDPFSARDEIAPSVFEDLFIPHLLPVIRWFADQRSRILLSSKAPEIGVDYDGGGSGSMEAEAAMSLLSRMSGGQAAELKELERGYEEVVDENIRVYAGYLKQILEDSSGIREVPDPPPMVPTRISGGGEGSEVAVMDEEVVDEAGNVGLKNGRYNPIWAEADQPIEFSNGSINSQSTCTKHLPSYPERVPPHLLTRLRSTERTKAAPNLNSDSVPAFSSFDNSEDSSSFVSEPQIEEDNTKMASFQPNQIQLQRQEQPSGESTCSSDPPMVDSDNILASGKQTPPKDFVCPITSHLFDDPVTLETGQTYERKAIQEWLDHGNSTCPITRHKLQSNQLPKTNYVLKRLIASWEEQNPLPLPSQSENPTPKSNRNVNASRTSYSRTSVISQVSIEGAVGDLRVAISHLCTSEILSESEMAVLHIERFWREASTEREILTILSTPAVVNGFVEILFNSVDSQVLRATVFLLLELASMDKVVIQTLTRVDSDVEGVVALFKKGLMEAAVLIYLLRPSWESLVEMDMVDALVMAIKRNEEDLYQMCLKSKTASVLLLARILRGEDDKDISMAVGTLISERAVESIVASLEADLMEEKIAAVGILLRCMEEDGNCRDIIADKAELGTVLESFLKVCDGEQFEIVHFLYELVKLNRRTFNEQILHIIKDKGAFSTMHTLLNYLQTALQDQTPIIAGLLLQLDILEEPRKMSIYREEAIDALIFCLRNSDFPNSQIAAAEVILALQGRFSSTGKPLARAFLLKRAGMNKSYRALMRAEQMGHLIVESEQNLEEEKAADAWDRKMAFILVSHEFGLLFEALAEGLKSKNVALFSACLVSATWLTHMLSLLPDTGIRGAARVCLLKHFILIFKSARDTDDKALAMLALRSFMHDPEGLQDLSLHMRDILKILRDLKKSSVLAYEMLKLFSEGQDSSVQDLWNHKELAHVDCSTHGEVSSIIHFKDRIYSGHSDGTIKVWSGSGSLLHPIQEIREHSKAVTSLAISQSGEKLYSGSIDKSVRVWSVGDEEIQCFEIHDMKDQVHNLTVANTIACYIPQGTGVKVLSWNGDSKLLNPNKHVRCLSLLQGKLYCGCHDSSIQEIDLATGTLSTIQTGSRKLLGKANTIYALQIHDGSLYSAGTSLDGAAVKVRSTSNYNVVGSLPCTMDVRSMTVSTELVYLGFKTGLVEVWSKEKLTRVGTLQTGTNGKVQCMAVDSDEEVLVIGTSDGRIQAWGLS